MPKPKVIIASVLKPVTDARLFEKLALSLAQTNKYRINIIGFVAKKNAEAAPKPLSAHQDHPQITQTPLFGQHRTHWKRWFTPLTFGLKLLKVKPELIIATSPEILAVSCAYKILFGKKVVYDVRENYFLNITHAHHYPTWLKKPLAHAVRAYERLLQPVIDHFLLAEYAYAKEMRFPEGKYSFLPNKMVLPAGVTLPNLPKASPYMGQSPLKLLYTGTIAKAYGIEEALLFTNIISNQDIEVQLTVAGYCPDRQYWAQLRPKLLKMPFVRLIGGPEPVPHAQILALIPKHHAALMPYQVNPSLQNCIPSKLYEYMAHQLPVIISPNAVWEAAIMPPKAGFMLDFKAFSNEKGPLTPVNTLIAQLKQPFYTTGTPQDAIWQAEKHILQQLVAQLIG